MRHGAIFSFRHQAVLIPAILLALVLAFTLGKDVVNNKIRTLYAISLITIGILWIFRFGDYIYDYKNQGLNNKYWSSLPVMKFIEGLEEEKLIYSNCYREIYINTGKVALIPPHKVTPPNMGLKENQNYTIELHDMLKVLSNNNGYYIQCL